MKLRNFFLCKAVLPVDVTMGTNIKSTLTIFMITMKIITMRYVTNKIKTTKNITITIMPIRTVTMKINTMIVITIRLIIIKDKNHVDNSHGNYLPDDDKHDNYNYKT